jgi:hypothetical protein
MVFSSGGARSYIITSFACRPSLLLRELPPQCHTTNTFHDRGPAINQLLSALPSFEILLEIQTPTKLDCRGTFGVA